ncbi:D-alanyl-D-alanine carboxypeptidase family protein [Paralcaligenes ureilyticus]|uniref:serine-type D-Ala-D-Ala carboxypeptidase n=1 Tax=Paralcaligenes ureilyticus TaxID=627131 RepID=A0A4R3MBH6_9BURK|nr:D-alanyl-D-alanine carboxypeptidase family protein [Paralcaligenes ureilyticus]TCT10890.1 D-alanyl-D-alanine carboxypeptidase (penicillin-binding protein 5/6) [Paralcaligenes ureilyticus]
MKTLILGLWIALGCVSGAWAQAVPAPALAAKAWLLLDATSGQVIAEQNADVRIEPASLTKIMTAYLVFKAIKDHRLSKQQTVTVSKRAWSVAPGSSKMFLMPGTKVTVDQLLNGLLVQSGNDAAVALAEATSGNVEGFVVQMNREAQAMGLHATHFANPNGLPNPGTYSSARDLSVLARHLIQDFPTLYKGYDTTRQFTYNKITQINRNRLLWLDPSVDGLKTGHTESAGYCLIGSALRPEGGVQRRLISVVLGAASNQARTQESLTLLNWGFQNFETVRLYSKGQVVTTSRVWKGRQNQVKLGFDHDVFLTLPRSAKIGSVPTVSTPGPLIAPLELHEPVATLHAKIDGKSLKLPLVTLDGVDQAGFLGRAWDSVALWVNQARG